MPITSYSINENGQVLLEVTSDLNYYYILKIRHSNTDDFKLATSMALGEGGTTIISKPLESYPLENYQVLQYEIAAPFDIDGDGEDDISEFHNRPTQSLAQGIYVVFGLTAEEDVVFSKKFLKK
ncbi:MAG: hypothetical protein ACI840_002064 [Ulvibacter sp.]